MTNKKKAPEGVKIIRTARSEEAINLAVEEGFRPLVLPVVANPTIKSNIAVYQHKVSGRIEVIGDFRSIPDRLDWKEVLPWTTYYPYVWPNPYAAYLIPPDLEVGDTVWLEDLIEDVIAGTWNQGTAWRLEHIMAVWTGHEFDLLYDEERDRKRVIG